jgi:mannose-6-phosphate isomerase-like protein (cupin superfamily)
MEAGVTVSPGKGEVFKCIRSAKDGGRFELEIEMAPGVAGPPTHWHPEPEHVEVVSGECLFWLDGKEHRLGPGDRLVIPPGVAHTFRITGRDKMVGRGTHGGRFERAVDQFAGERNGFTRMAMYLTYVDPHASYMKSRFVRAFLRVVAATGKLRGIRTL